MLAIWTHRAGRSRPSCQPGTLHGVLQILSLLRSCHTEDQFAHVALDDIESAPETRLNSGQGPQKSKVRFTSGLKLTCLAHRPQVIFSAGCKKGINGRK